jgi:hypothetical protein
VPLRLIIRIWTKLSCLYSENIEEHGSIMKVGVNVKAEPTRMAGSHVCPGHTL